jgi:hypothetical protein
MKSNRPRGHSRLFEKPTSPACPSERARFRSGLVGLRQRRSATLLFMQHRSKKPYIAAGVSHFSCCAVLPVAFLNTDVRASVAWGVLILVLFWNAVEQSEMVEPEKSGDDNALCSTDWPTRPNGWSLLGMVRDRLPNSARERAGGCRE